MRDCALVMNVVAGRDLVTPPQLKEVPDYTDFLTLISKG